MTRPEQVHQLAGLGVDYAGLIFYPGSPRYVLQGMTREEVRKLSIIKKVGVFVDAAIGEVLDAVRDCRLDFVQLHGEETPEVCAAIRAAVPVIKAFRIGAQDQPWVMSQAYKDSCDYFLFDTKGTSYGGTGRKFDWDALRASGTGYPFFLSGGIEPGDVTRIRQFREGFFHTGFVAVDLNSRFETAPGVKDMEKVERFVREMKSGTAGPIF